MLLEGQKNLKDNEMQKNVVIAQSFALLFLTTIRATS